MPTGSSDRDVYRAPIGTHDVLAPESTRWRDLVAAFATRAERFGYGLVLTPAFEHVEVFRRVGTATDVVSKEMYEFTDRGGRVLALRPEGSAPVVRAFVEHRPTAPWKAWYVAPQFRYERPQRGRYRQHHQVGVEAIGADDPDLDVEVVDLAWGFLAGLGLGDVRLRLNSMGDEASRAPYLEALRAYLLQHGASLGDEFRARVEQSPLRVLDAKHPDWQDVIERAPQLTEFLTDPAQRAFERVQHGLDALGIPYELDPRLVRGFDYYTGTVFELAAGALDAAQDAIGGGGRFDRLVEQMGGPPASGVGFGIGIERLLLAADAEATFPAPPPTLDAFVVDALGDLSATLLVHELRALGLRADRSYGGRSVKAQWREADRRGARYGVMLGADEAGRGAVAVKSLATGEQLEVPRDAVAAWIEMRRDEASEATP